MGRWWGARPRNPNAKFVRKLVKRARPKVGAFYRLHLGCIDPKNAMNMYALVCIQRVSRREVVVSIRGGGRWEHSLWGDHTVALDVFRENARACRQEHYYNGRDRGGGPSHALLNGGADIDIVDRTGRIVSQRRRKR